jgi:hypothetical protein
VLAVVEGGIAAARTPIWPRELRLAERDELSAATVSGAVVRGELLVGPSGG